MTMINLAHRQGRIDFFQHTILTNLDYWQNWVTSKMADIAVADRERANILRAIGFALDLETAWSPVFKLIIVFSPYMERRGYWDIWNGVLSRAVVLARQRGDQGGEANLMALLARLLFRQSRYRESVSTYRQAIKLARQVEDKFVEGRACTNLGYFYIEYSNHSWHRAEVLCCHALKLFREIDSQHGLAHTENHLGLLYMRQWRWDAARPHLERAYALWQAMGDDHGLMYGSMNLGGLYNEMGRPAQALPYLEKAFKQAKIIGAEAEIGGIYVNLSDSYRLQGDLVQAEQYARKAAEVFRHFANPVHLPLVWLNLGETCRDQGKWEEAEIYLLDALAAFRRSRNQYGEIKVLMSLIEYELVRKHHVRVKERLTELEKLIQQYDPAGQYSYLQSILTKYRRSLAG